MEILKNEYFSIIEEESKLYIVVSRQGFNIKDFNGIVLDNPTFSLSNFMNLKTALEEAKGTKTHIGYLKPRIDVIVSSDEMEARIILNITARELVDNKIGISSEIIEALNAKGVTEGLANLFQKPLTVQKEIVVAEGIPPTNGEDAILKYFELSDKKPVVKEDGSVNHYDLNLIDNVVVNAWVGEKIPPTSGRPGLTVTGKIIPGKNGRDAKLKYDRKTIAEFQEPGKIVLRALIDGAVKFDGDKIRIDNHLIIPGDVGFETGNINFDGYVTIKGTVKDGFSVRAKHDIEIMGPMGVGAVEEIISTDGSIYIKGGIYGKNTARIEAKKNVFVKYCNECTITAGDDINVGFYALDCSLSAKRILMDPVHGKIIGGNIVAQIQVVSGIIGNKNEKKTFINVQGFDRLAIKHEFESLLGKYKDLLQEASKVKRQLEIFEYSLGGAEYVNMDEYYKYVRDYESVIDEIKMLEEYRQKLQKILETKGEGEVGIFKAAYPETYLEIKKMSKKINAVVSGSFYAMNRELHQG
ncbi:MAG: DUF342 domain-containing protein [Bacillota bacterium]